jgi:hypothetical protein
MDASRFAVICSDAPRWGGMSTGDYADDLLAALKISRFAGGLIYTDVGISHENNVSSNYHLSTARWWLRVLAC